MEGLFLGEVSTNREKAMHAKFSILFYCGVFALIFVGAAPAFGGISFTATMTAAPDGPNYNYTITLNNSNTSTNNIETFWFAWIPGYDYLPSQPTVTQMPANWTTFIEHLSSPYSIEFYDTGTSDPITPGNSSSAFKFTSPDSPTTLATGTGFAGLPDTYSYVYSGPGESGTLNTIFSIPITTVPEPASIVLAGLGGLAGLMMWRKRRSGDE
jgi:hypothetical protein